MLEGPKRTAAAIALTAIPAFTATNCLFDPDPLLDIKCEDDNDCPASRPFCSEPGSSGEGYCNRFGRSLDAGNTNNNNDDIDTGFFIPRDIRETMDTTTDTVSDDDTAKPDVPEPEDIVEDTPEDIDDIGEEDVRPTMDAEEDPMEDIMRPDASDVMDPPTNEVFNLAEGTRACIRVFISSTHAQARALSFRTPTDDGAENFDFEGDNVETIQLSFSAEFSHVALLHTNREQTGDQEPTVMRIVLDRDPSCPQPQEIRLFDGVRNFAMPDDIDEGDFDSVVLSPAAEIISSIPTEPNITENNVIRNPALLTIEP